jgi:hypothetical protein
MPFNKRDKNQDVLMAEIMSKEDQDPGLVKPGTPPACGEF